MNIRKYTSVLKRRKALEKGRGISMAHTGSFSFDESVASKRNCENMIGATQVPIGVAGPLLLTSLKHQDSNIYIPLATTEGALVASVNRGCKAITASGGAAAAHHREGPTRGPVFKVKNLKESERLYAYIQSHTQELQGVAGATSNHLKLKKILTRGVGRYRFIRCVFDTQDAMGMNMVTIASQAISSYLEKETGVTCISVAGNFDIDKKPAWLNFIENRGMKVWAEATIPHDVLKKVLKTSAQKVHEVWLSKCMIGSAISGALGFNAQYANVVSSIFLATGQDLGHIGEASMGITTTEIVNDKDLYISVYLPDLMVGTVGGGTGLATQKEALELLGVFGGSQVEKKGENAARLAEIVGGAVLAGELSLLSSLEEGTLVSAHQRFARGGKPL